jgi:mannitol/fructose-specific phosphotransferase system IIA component (Ntr-type)
MANVYRELGKWEEAQGHIDWILSDPKRQNSLDTQIQAAELLQAAGEKAVDKGKAEQYFKEAIVGRKAGGSVIWGWGGISN